MTDKPISFMDDLAFDESPEREAGGPVMGLVVGGPMTEKEFVAEHGGDWRKRETQEIIFENERGEVETSSPREGIE